MFINPPWILSASERYNNISSVLGKSDQSDDISIKNAKTNNIQANLVIYNKQIKRWELCSCNNTRFCKQSFRFQQHQSKKKRFHRIIWRRKGSKEVALIWFKNNADNINNTLLICRDSKSLSIAILGKNSRVGHISSLIKYIYAKLTSQWILGHSKVTGNELADKAAKEIVCLSVVQFPIALSNALNFIKNVIKDGSITNNRTRKVYKIASSNWLCSNTQSTRPGPNSSTKIWSSSIVKRLLTSPEFWCWSRLPEMSQRRSYSETLANDKPNWR